MNSIVIVEHISKTLGDIRVIDDVSLDVGEFLAIQGPSGSARLRYWRFWLVLKS